MVSISPLYFLNRNASVMIDPKQYKVSESNIQEYVNESLNSNHNVESQSSKKFAKVNTINRNSFLQLYNCIDGIPESLENSQQSEFMLTRLVKQNMKSDSKMFLLASLDIMKVDDKSIIDILKIISFTQIFRIKLGVQLSANANIESSMDISNQSPTKEAPKPISLELLQREIEFQNAINNMKEDDSLHINVSVINKESALEKHNTQTCNRQKSYTQVPTNSEYSFEAESRNSAKSRALEIIYESYNLLDMMVGNIKSLLTGA